MRYLTLHYISVRGDCMFQCLHKLRKLISSSIFRAVFAYMTLGVRTGLLKHHKYSPDPRNRNMGILSLMFLWCFNAGVLLLQTKSSDRIAIHMKQVVRDTNDDIKKHLAPSMCCAVFHHKIETHPLTIFNSLT